MNIYIYIYIYIASRWPSWEGLQTDTHGVILCIESSLSEVRNHDSQSQFHLSEFAFSKIKDIYQVHITDLRW